MAITREHARRIGERVDAASGSGNGLTCPFDRTRLRAQYVTDLTVRVACTAGWLKDGVSHEFSLPITDVERHFRIER